MVKRVHFDSKLVSGSHRPLKPFANPQNMSILPPIRIAGLTVPLKPFASKNTSLQSGPKFHLIVGSRVTNCIVLLKAASSSGKRVAAPLWLWAKASSSL